MAANLVLVVEDNPDDETLTLRALGETGGAEKIVVAHDGAEALDFLLGPGRIAGDGSSLPRLVLLDLRMPRVDGFEVLRRLRAEPATHLVPVVILSSSTEGKDLFRSYGLGVNSWVRKPADSSRFIHVVREVGAYWLQLNEPPPAPGKL